MAIFKRPPIGGGGARKRRGDIPQGLFQKCPGCKEVVHEIELAQNQRVCPRCDYHFSQSAKERIENLLDPESFVERDAQFALRGHPALSGDGDLQGSPQEIPGRHGADGRGLERPWHDRGLQGGHRRDGLQFSRRHHGLGRGRTHHPHDRVWHGEPLRGRHRFRLGRRANVRRNAEPDADGENQRRPRAACRANGCLTFPS